MKRKIKFKALTPKGKWVYGLLSYNGNEYSIVREDGKGYPVLQWSISQLVIELPTNPSKREDSKILEIYEGDVIKVTKYSRNENYIAVVKSIHNLPEELFGSSVYFRKFEGNLFEMFYKEEVPSYFKHFLVDLLE